MNYYVPSWAQLIPLWYRILTERELLISGAGSDRGESYRAPNQLTRCKGRKTLAWETHRSFQNEKFLVQTNETPCSIRNMTGGPRPNRQQRPNAVSKASCGARPKVSRHGITVPCKFNFTCSRRPYNFTRESGSTSDSTQRWTKVRCRLRKHQQTIHTYNRKK